MFSKILPPLLLGLSLVGCAANDTKPIFPEPTPTKVSASAAAPEAVPPALEVTTTQLEVEQSQDQSLTPNGRTAYLGYHRGTDVLGPERSSELLAAVREQLVKKGYVMVFDRAKAYVDVSIYPYEQAVEPGSRGGLTFTGYVHTYGRRPQRWFSLNLASIDSLNGRWDTMKARALEAFGALDLKPPSRTEKGKGDPGCTPRFGYEYGSLRPGEDGHARITRVVPRSPAARAGVQVGDYLVAVDSLPPGAFEATEDQVYERRVAVPLKLVRDEKIVRTTVKAEVLCTY